MLSNEEIIKNLNLTGNFLEASIFSTLSESGHFLVTAEWPFSQPTFNGTGDIIALNHHVNRSSEPLVFFAIECKKVRADQKVWVFDANRGKTDILQPFLRVGSDGKRLYTDRTGYLLPSIGVSRTEDAPLFNKGYELRESDGNLNRNESEKIHTALTQSNRAFCGLVTSDYTDIFNVPGPLFEDRQILFVPIVITNATLKSINYMAPDIQMQTGEIDAAAVNIKDEDYIIFEHPLPSELQIRANYNGGDIRPIRRPTYVVSAEKALELMTAICDYAEY